MGSIELSPQEKLNELRLYVNDSSQIRRTLIFVEGISDIRFYRKLFNSTNTKVELVPSGGGRPPVELNYEEDPIFLTDGHDLEMMLLSNEEVFSSIANYYALGADSDSIRNLVYRLLHDISLIKLINKELGYNMKFKGFGFMHLLNVNGVTVNLDQFLRVVIAKGEENCTITIADVKAELLTRHDIEYDWQELTNGHDYVRTLAHIFREKYGHNGLPDTTIESAIQIAYTKEYFKMTQLYQKLQTWQESHAVEILIV